MGAEGSCVWKDADSESLSGGRRCAELFAMPGAPRRSDAVREAAHSELGARGDVVCRYVPAWWFCTCFIFCLNAPRTDWRAL